MKFNINSQDQFARISRHCTRRSKSCQSFHSCTNFNSSDRLIFCFAQCFNVNTGLFHELQTPRWSYHFIPRCIFPVHSTDCTAHHFRHCGLVSPGAPRCLPTSESALCSSVLVMAGGTGRGVHGGRAGAVNVGRLWRDGAKLFPLCHRSKAKGVRWYPCAAAPSGCVWSCFRTNCWVRWRLETGSVHSHLPSPAFAAPSSKSSRVPLWEFR